MKSLLLAMPIVLTACSTPSLAERINWEVNHKMTYEDDSAQYGVVDKWVTTCPAKGDCEDYALCKARQLLKQGYTPDRLTIQIVKDEARDVNHSVLLVDNKWVLDNLHDEPVRKASLPYRPYYGCRLDNQRVIYATNGTEIWGSNMSSFKKCVEAFAELRQ